jgi:hypothetical protein
MPNVCVAYLSGWVVPVLRFGNRRPPIARIEPPLRWAVPTLPGLSESWAPYAVKLLVVSCGVIHILSPDLIASRGAFGRMIQTEWQYSHAPATPAPWQCRPHDRVRSWQPWHAVSSNSRPLIEGLWELPWNWLKNRFLVRLTY